MGTIFCYKNELTFLSFALVLLSAAEHNVISGKNNKNNMKAISEMFIRFCAIDIFDLWIEIITMNRE